MSVDGEDKPEQELSKLADVADAAPIKHETLTTLHPEHHQPTPSDLLQVRMSEAGAAEADPLQNGHPADLQTPAAPSMLADSAPSGIWGVADSGCFSQQPATLPANSVSYTAEGATSSMPAPVSSHLHAQSGSANTPDMLLHDAYAPGMEAPAAAQIKDEEAQQAAGTGFQVLDADMANGEEDVDIGAYVKPDLETLLQQGSGSSGSEAGQAVLMDLDAQGRQPSPPARPASAQLGGQQSSNSNPLMPYSVHSLYHSTLLMLHISKTGLRIFNSTPARTGAKLLFSAPVRHHVSKPSPLFQHKCMVWDSGISVLSILLHVMHQLHVRIEQSADRFFENCCWAQ